MDCKKINSLLIDFADKKLDPEATKMVQTHLENCKICSQEVEELAIVMNEMNKISDQKPSPKLRSNFMDLIEKEKSNTKSIEAKPYHAKSLQAQNPRIRFINPMYQVAAGFAILISGLLLGLLINKNNGINNNELLALQNEVSYMKQVVMLSKLDQSSPSSRIQAVNYVDEISTPDPKVIDALIKTMNEDDNDNVRLAATTALSRFTENITVREALINSLATQEDPMVQITLINIMVGLHETKANKFIERIANNSETNKSVKTIAQKGLEILI
jgi:hypothetical protein